MILAKAYIGGPIFSPGTAFSNAFYDGVLSTPTSTQFEMRSDAGDYRIVFKGSFTVVGGDVTGGTLTSYDIFAGSTKVANAKGYAIDAATFFDALQADDPFAAGELLFNNPVKLIGSKLDDRSFASDFADTMLGKAGNDRLDGGLGDDLIKGGKGNDSLFGGEGFDKLQGDFGSDAFHFTFDSTIPPDSFDKIKDFKSGQDHIVIDDFAAILPSGYLAKSNFHVGTEAKTVDQVVIYDKKSGSVFYDADGSDPGAQFLLVKVAAGTKLHASDFFVGSDDQMIL